MAANKDQLNGFDLIHFNAVQENLSQEFNREVGIDRLPVRWK